MKLPTLLRRTLAAWHVVAALSLAGGAAVAAPLFAASNTVSDILGVAHETDPLLVNPWGLTIGPEGNLRVADDGSGVTTIYAPDGTLVTGTQGITIPSVSGNAPGSPTGIAENEAAFIIPSDANDFDITSGGNTAPAHYLLGTEDGEIVGYRESVSATNGIVEVTKTNAGYTGVALAWTGTGADLKHQLYAANFAQGTVDVYDSSFNKVTLPSGAFVPPSSVKVPDGAPVDAVWSPFNVKSADFIGPDPVTHRVGVQRHLLVAYALHSTTSDVLNDIPGVGNGFVGDYLTSGTWEGVLATPGSHLNSPWGMALAHHPLPGAPSAMVLLVGNHGDGQIRAFDFAPGTGVNGISFGPFIKDKAGNPLAFDGLWALKFGRVTISEAEYELTHAILGEGDGTLYFSAGLLGETHGLVGKILIP